MIFKWECICNVTSEFDESKSTVCNLKVDSDILDANLAFKLLLFSDVSVTTYWFSLLSK
jgi:hypothetical protein